MNNQYRTAQVSTRDLRYRLDASFYQPHHLARERNLARLGINSISVAELSQLVTDGTHKTPKYTQSGVAFLSATNISKGFIDFANHRWISETEYLNLEKWNCSAEPNDILIAKSGSIGNSAVVSLGAPPFAIFESVAIIRCGGIDPHYLSTFFNSQSGQDEILRQTKGAVIRHLHLEDLREVEVPILSTPAQTYIGDKVRQAERLRARARELEEDIKRFSVTEEILQAVQIADMRSGRVLSNDMWTRLDSKYYAPKAMAVYKTCQENGILLSDLIVGISNGFEERKFVDKGRVYITVSEVSSGRLNIENAPQIDFNVSVPAKAIVHERCVLVVRTGSIGNAVKVFVEDSGVSISSHLIRMEFETEEIAASVAAFLNSEAGKILQQKISYGAVQPQIGQEELTALSIPNFVLVNCEQIISRENMKEINLRFSSRLTSVAKLLVEALIEGKISENDLIAAQKSLEAGDREADRKILARLTTKGMDIPGEPPLFPDLDGLYEAMDALDAIVEAPI